jgi:hypothetical protein
MRDLSLSKLSEVSDSQVVESHDKCKFCQNNFGMSERERIGQKKQVIKLMKNPQADTQFEYFSLCLLSYQLNDTKNTKIT